jgi:hypothetical protein
MKIESGMVVTRGWEEWEEGREGWGKGDVTVR